MQNLAQIEEQILLLERYRSFCEARHARLGSIISDDVLLGQLKKELKAQMDLYYSLIASHRAELARAASGSILLSSNSQQSS